MAKKQKGLHVSDKNARLRYKRENRHSKNRKIKLIKHLAKHPNDVQAETCIDNNENGFPYRRKKPQGGFPFEPKKVKRVKWGYGLTTKTFGEKFKECLLE